MNEEEGRKFDLEGVKEARIREMAWSGEKKFDSSV